MLRGRVAMGSRGRSAKAVCTSWLAGLALLALAQGASAASSLPKQQGTAPRPGPAVLYEPLAVSPELTNAARSGWKAKPILISGASAYRKGEFLYQGYVYDDRGAKEVTDPSNPMPSPGGDAPAAGLWDAANDRYLLPGAERSETTGGGAREVANPPAFYDVAFRYNAQEPVPGTPGPSTTADPAWWRESAQSNALASGDI